MNDKNNKGITRNIDSLGRVVIPKEFRKILNIKEHDPVEIICENRTIKIKKQNNSCTLCDSEEDLKNIKGIFICKKCLNEIKEVIE